MHSHLWVPSQRPNEMEDELDMLRLSSQGCRISSTSGMEEPRQKRSFSRYLSCPSHPCFIPQT
ncbi:hypothetical protein SLEP1_g51086 [Rubroshorea leprosula]|nr:hypothetical protein SLEP1_g51086 [Rubroshorea leprosula]